MSEQSIFSYVLSSEYLHKNLKKTFWDTFTTSNIIKPYSFKGLDKEFDFPKWWLSKDGGLFSNNEREKEVWTFVQNMMNLFVVIGKLPIDREFLILDNTSLIRDVDFLDRDLTNILNNLPDDWDIIFLSGYESKSIKVNEYISTPVGLDLTNSFLVKEPSTLLRIRQYILDFPTRKYFGDYLISSLEDLNLKYYISNKRIFYPYNSSSFYKKGNKHSNL